jgi:hypothetical protein
MMLVANEGNGWADNEMRPKWRKEGQQKNKRGEKRRA